MCRFHRFISVKSLGYMRYSLSLRFSGSFELLPRVIAEHQGIAGEQTAQIVLSPLPVENSFKRFLRRLYRTRNQPLTSIF